MLLKDQTDIQAKRPMPVEDVSDSSKGLDVSAETAQMYYYDTGTLTIDAGEAAGTAVIAKLAYRNVYNSIGSHIGDYKDTSLSFTSTALTTEVDFPWEKLEQSLDSTGTALLDLIVEDFSNGDYCVDYSTGTIYGVKTSTQVTLTSTAYKVIATSAELVTGDIQIGSVEIKDGTTDARQAVKVDNATAGATPTVALTGGIYKSTLDTYADNDASPVHMDSSGRILVATTNSTATVLTGGDKTVTTAGTAEALGTTLTTKSIYIRAKLANTNPVFVGDSAVDKTSSQQIVLYAGEDLTIDIADRATVYVDVTTNSEGVDYLCTS